MGSKVRKTNPAVGVAYIRHSTLDQRESPEVQRQAIAAWAAAHNVTVASEHIDAGVSGATEVSGRPGLVAALADVAARRAGVLIVMRRDRVARDATEAGIIDRAVERLGARVVATDTGDVEGMGGLVMRRMLDVVAEVERRLISERTRAALAAKRARGERVGQVPLGSRAIGARLVVDPAEARGLDAARDWRAEGVSWRRVVARLGVEHPRSRGRRWHLSAVARVLGGGR